MKTGATWALVLALLGATAGCVPITGVPSLTLLSRDVAADSPDLELIGGPIEVSESWTWALVFLLWGERPTHESVLAEALERHDADLLLDAELKTTQYGIPYLFMVSKTTASGQPARFRHRGGP